MKTAARARRAAGERRVWLVALVLLPALLAGCRSPAGASPTASPVVAPATDVALAPCSLLQPGDIQPVVQRAVSPGAADPTRREPNCLWSLAGTGHDAVAVRLYTTMMTLWEQPQPQDDQVVSELPAEAHWDTHAHYLAVRRGRQAFHVQLYSADSADQQLRACVALARIILSRLPS